MGGDVIHSPRVNQTQVQPSTWGLKTREYVFDQTKPDKNKTKLKYQTEMSTICGIGCFSLSPDLLIETLFDFVVEVTVVDHQSTDKI